jgi:hypothetical protein
MDVFASWNSVISILSVDEVVTLAPGPFMFSSIPARRSILLVHPVFFHDFSHSTAFLLREDR